MDLVTNRELYNHKEGKRISFAEIECISAGKEFIGDGIVNARLDVYKVLLYDFAYNPTLSEIITALEDLFTLDCTCSMESDCCGCWFGGVESIRFDGKYFLIGTKYNRNY